MSDPMKKITEQLIETRRAISKIKSLRAIENPTDLQLKELALLVSRMNTICPSFRFKWIDGAPAIDIFEKLLTEEKEKEKQNG